jgi:peptidyl-prolyl cis-trans isomerase SurA
MVLGVLLSIPAAVQGNLVNRVVATIDGAPVTLYELGQFRQRAARVQQLSMADEASLLDALITDLVIQKEVRDQGITIQDEDVNRYIEGIRIRNNLTEEQLHTAVAQQGITWEDYRKQVREDLQKVQLINREVRGKVSITPEDVQRYYEAHRDEYSTPAAITISHIVLRTPDNATAEQIDALMSHARALYKRLKEGADFAELAREYSEDAAAADGGGLGTFKKGEMLEEFERVVEKLKPGQFSEPIRTRVGIHIVRLDERIGSGYQPLEKLADEIREQLYSKAMEERYERFLREDVRQRHHVEILE